MDLELEDFNSGQLNTFAEASIDFFLFFLFFFSPSHVLGNDLQHRLLHCLYKLGTQNNPNPRFYRQLGVLLDMVMFENIIIWIQILQPGHKSSAVHYVLCWVFKQLYHSNKSKIAYDVLADEIFFKYGCNNCFLSNFSSCSESLRLLERLTSFRS